MNKLKLASFATAAVLAMAGAANAKTVEVNVFGASAQFDFWNTVAPSYLGTTLGCTIGAHLKDNNWTGKYGVTVGTNCQFPGGALTGFAVGDNITIRYSSKASYDGINALQGGANTGDTNGSVAPYNATCQAAGFANNYRWMGDETNIISGPDANGLYAIGLKCQPVNVAASDVAASSFVQASSGNKLGPMLGTFPYSKSKASITVSATTPVALSSANPVVVPFGMFVNKSVTYNKCITGAPNAGKLCYQDADCGGAAASCSGIDTGNGNSYNTIDGITREMATAIFANSIVHNWRDFGGYFTAKPIVSCFRHAGSGTHATLDLEVMNKNWGATLPALQKLPTAAYTDATYQAGTTAAPNLSTANVIWFNDGTPDELNCIQGASAVGAWTTATALTTSDIGAIGYADADKAVGINAQIIPIKYNGNLPSREAIRNGRYEFFTNEWMYWDPANTDVATVSSALDAFAGNPANLTTANVGAARVNYWAARGEMQFNRASEGAWPLKGTATNPQTP